MGATSSFGVQAVYKKTKNLIGWYILDDAEYEIFNYTDPWTGQVFELRDYGDQGPTTMKGNSCLSPVISIRVLSCFQRLTRLRMRPVLSLSKRHRTDTVRISLKRTVPEK